ncbi:hypothetical protein ABFS82_03G006100 [Erythranthe guttata]|uniref:Uncharacterized protein n=1 Tax=Erythranthe guttata TaxID=4155 RepID=A0A022RN10_ERYGU|nr:PREDICTED: outer envelope pore protein 21B, chloroplastic [Erythranthe guttata]EYU41178.1 hypothetical protein MIMGU_mgv1a015110mg [Erythranthe guttata]|eukprot:XP_012832774.1 PREDICTED: outer envelope pore protein 21B, chloroplastic [Erythranthe guttata]
METSLRYGGDSKSLCIRAKEKLPVGDNIIWESHAELDTKAGAPTFLSSMLRFYYPDLSTSLGVGAQYNKNRKIHYHVRGKHAFPVTSDRLISFNIKGRCNTDEEFKKVSYTGAAELVCNIFNVKKDQDLRVKLGYDLMQKLPYLQVRENNWTFNADGNCKWNVRYDL